MLNTVTKQLAENFFSKKPRKGRPGVALIAVSRTQYMTYYNTKQIL